MGSASLTHPTLADARRGAELVRRGYRVIHFWNNEVLDNLDGVLETIRRALESDPPCVFLIGQNGECRGIGEGPIPRRGLEPVSHQGANP